MFRLAKRGPLRLVPELPEVKTHHRTCSKKLQFEHLYPRLLDQTCNQIHSLHLMRNQCVAKLLRSTFTLFKNHTLCHDEVKRHRLVTHQYLMAPCHLK